MTSDADPTNSPKAMGFADILAFCLGTGISLRWISIAAAAGPASVSMWLLAMLLFYIPLVFVVAEMSARFDGEGGVYLWTREAMGEFSAFVCGWCYWTANIAYLPSLLIFSVGAFASLAGIQPETIAPLTMFAICTALMALLTVINVIGLDKSKWVTSLGGWAVWVTLLIIVGAGGAVWWSGAGVMPTFSGNMLPTFGTSTVLLWAVVTFGLSGTEGVSFVRTDIRGGQKTLVRALLIAGVLIMAAYLAGTLAVMAVLKTDEIGALGGVPQAITAAVNRAGWGWLAPVGIILLGLSSLGGANAWFGASARLPFAAGIDNFLPKAFGRRHPRYNSPHVALVVQAAFVILFLGLSQAGNSSGGSYAFLIRMSILGYSIPYLFIFWSYIRVQNFAVPHGTWLSPGGQSGRRLIGWVGLLTTISAIAATLTPDPAEGNPASAFAKVLLAGLVLILAGIFAYVLASRRRARSVLV